MSPSIGNMLQQYLGTGPMQATNIHSDFDQVAQEVPKESLSDGIAATFRSEQTPPFGQMIAHLFSQSNPQQQSGILQHLLMSAGPAAQSSLAGGGMLAGLASLLKGGNQITPEQVGQVSPEAVQELAAHAEKNDPGVIDKLSDFYAQHPGLIKTLGGAALAILMAKMAHNHSPN